MLSKYHECQLQSLSQWEIVNNKDAIKVSWVSVVLSLKDRPYIRKDKEMDLITKWIRQTWTGDFRVEGSKSLCSNPFPLSFTLGILWTCLTWCLVFGWECSPPSQAVTFSSSFVSGCWTERLVLCVRISVYTVLNLLLLICLRVLDWESSPLHETLSLHGT